MKPSEIQVGRTYKRPGVKNQRTVVKIGTIDECGGISWHAIKTHSWVRYRYPGTDMESFCTLPAFARWAKEEVK